MLIVVNDDDDADEHISVISGGDTELVVGMVELIVAVVAVVVIGTYGAILVDAGHCRSICCHHRHSLLPSQSIIVKSSVIVMGVVNKLVGAAIVVVIGTYVGTMDDAQWWVVILQCCH